MLVGVEPYTLCQQKARVLPRDSTLSLSGGRLCGGREHSHGASASLGMQRNFGGMNMHSGTCQVSSEMAISSLFLLTCAMT